MHLVGHVHNLRFVTSEYLKTAASSVIEILCDVSLTSLRSSPGRNFRFPQNKCDRRHETKKPILPYSLFILGKFRPLVNVTLHCLTQPLWRDCLVRPNFNFTKPSNSCCQVIFFARTEYSFGQLLTFWHYPQQLFYHAYMLFALCKVLFHG